MNLALQLKEEMKQAMRDKNEVKLTTIRGVLSALTNESINLGRGPGGELTDEEVLVVIKREVKRRRDAVDQFRAGGREDLAENDMAEIAILEPYLPAMMSQEAIRPLAEAKIAEMGADKSKAGQVMGALMRDLAGQADGGDVKIVVEQLLG